MIMTTMNRLRILAALLVMTIMSGIACTQANNGGLAADDHNGNKPVLTGLDVIERDGFSILEGKRVGVITNATGVNSPLRSIVDIFYEADNFELVALYGPEHGVRGDYPAGEYVQFYTDERTGLPVYSLYGTTRKPTPDMLEGVDVLVFDIQDIGTRSYTYISTMGLAMEAAAENGVKMVVLDRPNPLGGNKIEGNLAEDGYISFVSQFHIPYVHGLTVAELALMLNAEGMLTGGVTCDLTVVPMENWTRDMTFEETGLIWVPTSPHIPHRDSPIYYVVSGILGELQVISEGVGYTMPFQVFGAEWIDSDEVAARLNALELPGVIFRPVTWRPFYGRDMGKNLHGVQIHISDYEELNLMSLQFWFMQINNELYPDKNPFRMATDTRIRMFDRVAGTSEVRRLFMERMRYEDVEAFLNKDIEPFRELSRKYYLYN
jgi:uncharacterized protein YbbC (DUF1343 family)